jgi:hypothetical protein
VQLSGSPAISLSTSSSTSTSTSTAASIAAIVGMQSWLGSLAYQQ